MRKSARGWYEIPDLRGHRKRQFKILMAWFGWGRHTERNWALLGDIAPLTLIQNQNRFFGP
jgi:hypothetical protein